jgi:hypothetical protein
MLTMAAMPIKAKKENYRLVWEYFSEIQMEL